MVTYIIISADILISILLPFLILISTCLWVAYAHTHVHIEQVGSGEVDVDITQIGYDSFIAFSFAHSENTYKMKQTGTDN